MLFTRTVEDNFLCEISFFLRFSLRKCAAPNVRGAVTRLAHSRFLIDSVCFSECVYIYIYKHEHPTPHTPSYHHHSRGWGLWNTDKWFESSTVFTPSSFVCVPQFAVRPARMCVCVCFRIPLCSLSLFSCISHGWTEYHFDCAIHLICVSVLSSTWLCVIHLICVEGLLDTLFVLCLTPVRV